jgi:anti-sigma-K factor RskA
VKVEQIPVPPDGEVSAAAVTVEPESGSSQPTSPILLVGPLKRS